MDRRCHAYHEYEISLVSGGITAPVATVSFQTGPIKEAGVNGCSNEDLLAIVLDRLQCLQAGRFPCKQNEDAIRHVKCALVNLHDRTREREKRGVEGQHKA